MIIKCFLILLVFFIIAGFAIFYWVRKSDNIGAVKAVITKYFWYLIIVVAVSFVILTESFTLKIIFILTLLLKGFLELAWLQIKRVTRLVILVLYGLLGILAGLYFVSLDSRILLPVYVFVVVFDGMSQIGGQLIGKHKLARHVSPAKTWEGLLVGSFCACLAMVYILSGHCYLSYYHLIGLCVFALGGDLITSKIKRMANVKDFDNIIPGHGGVLDRFDSFLGVLVYLGLIKIFELYIFLCLD